jgi:serine/threonine protein kinase
LGRKIQGNPTDGWNSGAAGLNGAPEAAHKKLIAHRDLKPDNI